MRKILALLMALMLVFAGCAAEPAEEPEQPVETEEPALTGEVVVLYTNDVHCGVSGNLGYAGIATVKDTLEKQGKTVILVDNGDAV